jgi:hypothetical protein
MVFVHSLYFVKQEGEKCRKCGGPHQKWGYLNPSQVTTPNLDPNQPCSHCNMYGCDVDYCFTLQSKL